MLDIHEGHYHLSTRRAKQFNGVVEPQCGIPDFTAILSVEVENGGGASS